MSGCPHQHQHATTPPPPSEGGLHPANAMPSDLDKQLPSPGQKSALSTQRSESSIPRGGEGEGNWQYPSPQMFYNALKRKGWKPNESDVNAVVAIHNAVNEKAWSQVLKWEALHPQCQPRLSAIRGLANTPSPRARMWTWLGYAPPFDRHDWHVDRCGETVRYIIDYYETPPPPGGQSGAGLYLDVRPALDSATAAWDRMRKALLHS